MSQLEEVAWFRAFARRLLLPDNYLTFDVETSGLSPENNYICGVGMGFVEGRKLVRVYEAFLDWTRCPDIDQDHLRAQLFQVQQAMARQGKPCHHTYEFLREHGQPPMRVLEECLAAIEKHEDGNGLFAGHNSCSFDVEFFQSHFHNWLRIPYRFPEDGMYDTGIAEKASQLADSTMLPRAGETLRAFFRRVASVRARGVKWALDVHCEAKYGISQKIGMSAEYAHRPAYDAAAVHHVVEAHRQRMLPPTKQTPLSELTQ